MMASSVDYDQIERALRELQRSVGRPRQMLNLLQQIDYMLNGNNNRMPIPRNVEHTIAAFTTVTVSREDQDNLTCSVCLDDFRLCESVKELPCNHKYHPKCIGGWLKDHNTCPMCRRKIVSDGKRTTAPLRTPATERVTRSRAAAQRTEHEHAVQRRITRQMSRQMQQEERRTNRG